MKNSAFADNVKRGVLLFICFCLLFSSAACRSGGDDGGEGGGSGIPGGILSVPCSSEDSLNPFFMKSVMNSALISLVYQSLYYLDAGYTVNRELARSETVTAGSVKVVLADDAVFSDGTPLTVQDVIYSFDFAKGSELFSVLLSGVDSCESVEEGTVSFRLAYPDVNVLNALSFPIVKRGTATTSSALPVGTGVYCYHQDGIRISLIYNLLYAGETPAIGTVRLTEVGQNTTLETLVDTGELDFCYSDLASGSAKRTYSSVSYVYLNNLVFLGANSESINLQIADLRRAVSYAIDRQEIVQSGFQGFARSAGVPFNTSWNAVSDLKLASSIPYYADKVKASELFARHGAGKEDNVIYLTLICPDNNSFLRNSASVIAKELAGYYVSVNVKLLSAADYTAALRAGEYDLYIGEIKIPRTMDLSAFFSPTGPASYGINTDCAAASSYFGYRSGECSIDAFVADFLNDMPFIPLCYRNGRICYTPEIEYTASVADGRIFGGISGWKFK